MPLNLPPCSIQLSWQLVYQMNNEAVSLRNLNSGSAKDSEKQQMCHYAKASTIDIHPQKATFVLRFASVNYCYKLLYTKV